MSSTLAAISYARAAMPFDVIHTIVGLVYEEHDLSTLIAVSATCLQCLPLCRKLIFSRIGVSVEDLHETPGQLSLSVHSLGKLLKSRPSIARYIAKLEINASNPVFPGEELLPLLPRLTFVKTLLLTCKPLQTLYMLQHRIGRMDDWTYIKQSTRHCVDCLLRKPSITELEISHLYYFPDAMFAICPTVTRLSLNDVTFSKDGPQLGRPAKPMLFSNIFRPRLTQLEIGRNFYGFGFFNAIGNFKLDPESLDFSGVKALSIYLQWNTQLPLFSRLMHKVERLDTLQLTMEDSDPHFPGHFSILHLMGLPATRHIRHLKLVYLEGYSGTEELLGVAPCVDALRRVQRKELLETVSIQLRSSLAYQELIEEDLKTLDAALTDHEFRSLNRVGLTITIAAQDTRSIPTPTPSTLVQHLVHLSAHPSRGLDFEFVVETDPE
ncbi:hypothetical protein GALMADRAFT_210181 [Galerina marginata CBS 339.88]|uniref:F-box domain-containing protein n=1 Tax=Galerina marginata (strain CBS 339.88) TaxID=685588 RepID=A0A067T3X6_GALM3|nr:hypothetical protein GALMADRAFT_210181 [Galerina marginata CBS 339.88]